MPDLELDLPQPRSKPAASTKKVAADEPALELAVDLREGMHSLGGLGGLGAPSSRFGPPSAPRSVLAVQRAVQRHVSVGAPVGDVGFDARLLADYGRVPERWLGLPFYAWRVLRRRGELRASLVSRRAEAERTRREAEDALVAFSGRVRATIETGSEKTADYATAFIDLRTAEGVLRSRDHVLASEQDAHTARLSSAAERLGRLEGELARAQTEERMLAVELASAQAAASREEAKLKRVEADLRATQAREGKREGDAPA